MTKTQRQYLINARDNGSAWHYAPGRSLAWHASRQRAMERLEAMGLLTHDDKITPAGLAVLAPAAPAIVEQPAPDDAPVTTLNRLPVIITAPGIYRTRDGRRVQIHTLKPNPDLTCTSFTAAGATERMFRGKLRFRGHNIWHVSGRAYPLQESPRDIVAPEMTARLADIRAAIESESVSYGEIAELQAIAESDPAALAGDLLLQEWAGIPESEASK